MVKKGVKGSSKTSVSPVKKRKMTAGQREELLIENFVGLQKAMTNLSMRFESLSGQIVKLLQVFEESAKSYLQGGSRENDKDMLNKIDSLLNQNKTIAKGLVIMEEKLRGRAQSPGVGVNPPIGGNMIRGRPKPLPRG